MSRLACLIALLERAKRVRRRSWRAARAFTAASRAGTSGTLANLSPAVSCVPSAAPCVSTHPHQACLQDAPGVSCLLCQSIQPCSIMSFLCNGCVMTQAGTKGWPSLILVLSAVFRAGARQLPGAGHTCESRCVCRGQQGIPSASSSSVKGAAGIGFACAAAAERAPISRASPALMVLLHQHAANSGAAQEGSLRQATAGTANK